MPGIKDNWFTHIGGADRDRLERMIVNAAAAIPILENATRTPAAWNGLTAAQRQEHTRVAIFGLTRIARLLLEQLEAE